MTSRIRQIFAENVHWIIVIRHVHISMLSRSRKNKLDRVSILNLHLISPPHTRPIDKSPVLRQIFQNTYAWGGLTRSGGVTDSLYRWPSNLTKQSKVLRRDVWQRLIMSYSYVRSAGSSHRIRMGTKEIMVPWSNNLTTLSCSLC